MARHLTEPAKDMIIAYLRANLPTALQQIEADRNAIAVSGNPGIPLPPPREYFIAKNFLALQPPSCFVVTERVDFKKSRGANHINATARFGIVAIVEAQRSDLTTRMADRYVAAFSQVLDNRSLTSTDNTFRLVVICQGVEFSEDYTVSTQKGNGSEMWRKGFKLNCDVEFYEAL